MCCHEMNHLHAIIRYHFFDFDVCVVIFNVSYIESFYEKYSMFGKSKILCMSFSVIETYDLIFHRLSLMYVIATRDVPTYSPILVLSEPMLLSP